MRLIRWPRRTLKECTRILLMSLSSAGRRPPASLQDPPPSAPLVFPTTLPSSPSATPNPPAVVSAPISAFGAVVSTPLGNATSVLLTIVQKTSFHPPHDSLYINPLKMKNSEEHKNNWKINSSDSRIRLQKTHPSTILLKLHRRSPARDKHFTNKPQLRRTQPHTNPSYQPSISGQILLL